MTYYFYDLETSGISPQWGRIMQFAGQRTDTDLNPIGEPHNIMVRLGEDILPDPEAVMVTGITPQMTHQDGVTEAELFDVLDREVFTPNTVMLGYNTLRFDDEFLRYGLYRNFFDPYEREWAEGRSRWDMIDVVRMTRALRPDGIEWPFSEDGTPTNRLEKLSEVNGLTHDSAHDALSDVTATIELARLIRKKQPKLFDHLFGLRNKRKAAALLSLDNPSPVVHSTGRFGSENLNTSAVIPIAPHPAHGNAILAYDLRHSPKPFADYTVEELKQAAFTPTKELMKADKPRLPVKTIQLNRSPALAPIGVLDKDSQERINLTLPKIKTHIKELSALQGFGQRVHEAWRQEEREVNQDVDAQLYSGFLNDADRKLLSKVRQMSAEQLADWQPQFSDERMNAMFLKYKARNFPQSLSADESAKWEQYRAKRLTAHPGPLHFDQYFKKLAQLAEQYANDTEKKFLLEELQLYGQAIMPFENESLL